jgi:hypothetical protein
VAELTPLADLEDAFLRLTGTAPRPGQFRQVDDAEATPLAEGRPIEVDAKEVS